MRKWLSTPIDPLPVWGYILILVIVGSVMMLAGRNIGREHPRVASVAEVETVPAVSSEGRWIVTRSPSGVCYEAFRWADGPNRAGQVVGGPVTCP